MDLDANAIVENLKNKIADLMVQLTIVEVQRDQLIKLLNERRSTEASTSDNLEGTDIPSSESTV